MPGQGRGGGKEQVRSCDDAGYFARDVRTIEVLVDRDAVASGAAAAGEGEPWQYYSPTEDERAAVDDGHAALDALLDRLVDIATPAGPTPRRIGAPSQATLLPVIEINRKRARMRRSTVKSVP